MHRSALRGVTMPKDTAAADSYAPVAVRSDLPALLGRRRSGLIGSPPAGSVPQERIGPPFVADRAGRTVAGQHNGVVRPGQQLFANGPDQLGAVTPRQVATSDGPGEQRVSGEQHA